MPMALSWLWVFFADGSPLMPALLAQWLQRKEGIHAYIVSITEQFEEISEELKVFTHKKD